MKLEYNFVRSGVFNLPRSDWLDFDPDDSIIIESNWTMANLAVIMELFPSVSQAKKNGWAGPIPHGYTEKRKIGKMNKSMFIWYPSQEFIDDPDYGK
ncbi:hypothetical protein EBR43_05440 [bacterium]|nr:hypothetical protein [bacterium]